MFGSIGSDRWGRARCSARSTCPSPRSASRRSRSSHPAVGPAEILAGRDAARALTELLSRLADGERLVLELALFEGMRYADIADALLIPEGTVKSRVFHAIRKLRSWTLHKEEWT